jgi:hypothetical protein
MTAVRITLKIERGTGGSDDMSEIDLKPLLIAAAVVIVLLIVIPLLLVSI